jgi:hypothetical protein
MPDPRIHACGFPSWLPAVTGKRIRNLPIETGLLKS